MLILATLSGIQDFLFDVRETGGGQARSLRYRSFRIQLIAECVAERLLAAAELSHESLLFNAAAKVCIDAGDLSEASKGAIRDAACDIARRLLHQTHGRLRFAWAIVSSKGNFAHDFDYGNRLLAVAKFQPLHELAAAGSGPPAWLDSELVLPQTWNPDAEAESDTDLGRRLVKAKWLAMYRPDGQSHGETIEAVGLRLDLSDKPPEDGTDLTACSNLNEPNVPPPNVDLSKFRVRRFARHVPHDEHGNPVEFLDLAKESHGAPMLGVLKADADSLGAAVMAAIRDATDAQPLRRLSEALDRFFVETLEAEKQGPGSRWNTIYTVFSGGDDLLAVGPWDVVLDFAGHMRSLFNRAFGHEATGSPSPQPLTISAGIAIIKPRYPVHLAAQQAEELLDQAKTNRAPRADSFKDQCAALGSLWKWEDHDRIVKAGKQLAEWADTGVIQRGWLHTLLQLAMLRRGQAGPEFGGMHPAIATSRLAYHIARNWPKQTDRNEQKQMARAWADTILKEFDRFDTTSHCETIYLPAIVRYAHLATRSGTEE
jgi:CRISPR-associated protein Csm1